MKVISKLILYIYIYIMSNDKLIIYADMVADLFHAGHINFFLKIKKKYPQSKIYVGLMGDNDAISYKRKPILNVHDRETMLEHCSLIDKVIKNAPMPITKDFLKDHDIDIVIHSDDTTPEYINHWYKVPSDMGIYIEVEYTQGISTTDIINRIKNL
jgi:cytidyltransferase-like protein